MPQGTILTNQGLLRLATATPEDQIGIPEISVGDGSGGYPSINSSMTALHNEVWRGTALAPTRDPNDPTVLIFRVVIPIEDGGFTIREAALWDEYGAMIAICHTATVEKSTLASPYAVACTIKIRVKLSNTEQVSLFSVDDGGFDHAELSGRTEPDCHSIGAITGLTAALAAKSNTGHGHAISDVSGLSDELDSLAESIAGASAIAFHVPVRQAVLSGLVDSNGRANYISATGAKEITIGVGSNPPMVIAFAAGFDQYGAVDYVAQINANAVLDLTASLVSTGTYYIYADRDISTGAISYGVTMSKPNYVHGTPSTTFDEHTFVIQEMKMYRGSGVAAAEKQRVFLGQLLYAASTVQQVRTYALAGKAQSTYLSYPSAGGSVSFSHYLGIDNPVARYRLKCVSADLNYAVGDIVHGPITGQQASGQVAVHPILEDLAVSIRAPSGTAGQLENKTTGDRESLTSAKWQIQFDVERGW